MQAHFITFTVFYHSDKAMRRDGHLTVDDHAPSRGNPVHHGIQLALDVQVDSGAANAALLLPRRSVGAIRFSPKPLLSWAALRVDTHKCRQSATAGTRRW